jgi:hypothetical protein
MYKTHVKTKLESTTPNNKGSKSIHVGCNELTSNTHVQTNDMSIVMNTCNGDKIGKSFMLH